MSSIDDNATNSMLGAVHYLVVCKPNITHFHVAIVSFFFFQSIDYADESSCLANSNNYTSASFDYGSSYANDSADPAKRPSSSSSVVDEPPLAKRLMYERQQSSAELFSRYIATSLEALPPRLSVQAQKEVHDVLVKYKFLELDQLEQQR